jgi:hypothetical protein
MLVLISTGRRLMLAHNFGQVPATEKLPQRDLHERRDGSSDSVPFKARQGFVHTNRGLCIDQSLHAGRSGQARPLFSHASHSSPRSIAQHLARAVALLLNSATLRPFPRIYRKMEMTLAIGNPWSNQEADIWQLSGGSWFIIRRGIPLWNWMGTLFPHPRMQAGFYLFPRGFVPMEQVA